MQLLQTFSLLYFTSHTPPMNYSFQIRPYIQTLQTHSTLNQSEHCLSASFSETKVINQPSVQENTEKKVSYRWQPSQHKKYINFLIQRRELFSLSLQDRIIARIHNLMSKYIKSRTSFQCRSHHQKMMLKHKTVDKIISAQTKLQAKAPAIEKSTVKEQYKSHKDLLFVNFFQFELFPAKSKVLPFENEEDQLQSCQYKKDVDFDLE